MPVLTEEKRLEWRWINTRYSAEDRARAGVPEGLGSDDERHRQGQYHFPCKALCGSEDLFCPKCGAANPDCFVWSDVLEFVKAMRLDQEESFGLMPMCRLWGGADRKEADPAKSRVYDSERGVRRIAVWWTPGDNEGYYVHVEEIAQRPSAGNAHASTCILLGKGWSLEWAERATLLLQRFICSQGHCADPALDAEAASVILNKY